MNEQIGLVMSII